MGRMSIAHKLENIDDVKNRGIKFCCSCYEKKPVENFYTSQSSSDGYAYICKPCARIRGRQTRTKADRQRFVVSNFPEILEKPPTDKALIHQIKIALIEHGYVKRDSDHLTNYVFNLIIRIKNKVYFGESK